MRGYALLLMVLWTACSAPPDGGRLDQGGSRDAASMSGDMGPGDLASGIDGGAGCVGLGECECLARKDDCQPIAEPCWCPYPTCAPGACVCGGGQFLGCAPQASHCAPSLKCLPAGRPGPQDEKGCITCAYQNDCKRAFEQMSSTCSAKKGFLSGFSCDKNPECVTKCVNQLATCEDIGCGLCGTCGCARIGPFEQCFYNCMTK